MASYCHQPYACFMGRQPTLTATTTTTAITTTSTSPTYQLLPTTTAFPWPHPGFHASTSSYTPPQEVMLPSATEAPTSMPTPIASSDDEDRTATRTPNQVYSPPVLAGQREPARSPYALGSGACHSRPEVPPPRSSVTGVAASAAQVSPKRPPLPSYMVGMVKQPEQHLTVLRSSTSSTTEQAQPPETRPASMFAPCLSLPPHSPKVSATPQASSLDVKDAATPPFIARLQSGSRYRHDPYPPLRTVVLQGLPSTSTAAKPSPIQRTRRGGVVGQRAGQHSVPSVTPSNKQFLAVPRASLPAVADVPAWFDRRELAPLLLKTTCEYARYDVLEYRGRHLRREEVNDEVPGSPAAASSSCGTSVAGSSFVAPSTPSAVLHVGQLGFHAPTEAVAAVFATLIVSRQKEQGTISDDTDVWSPPISGPKLHGLCPHLNERGRRTGGAHVCVSVRDVPELVHAVDGNALFTREGAWIARTTEARRALCVFAVTARAISDPQAPGTGGAMAPIDLTLSDSRVILRRFRATAAKDVLGQALAIRKHEASSSASRQQLRRDSDSDHTSSSSLL